MKQRDINRLLFKFILLGLILVLSGNLFLNRAYATNSKEKYQFSRIDPVTAVNQMGAGWNLGNTLDATPTEGSWNNPPVTAKTFDLIKAGGFASVRIPVTWTHHMGQAPDYKVDPVWMNRVSDVVDMALDRGLYVILNVHHDSWEWADLSDKNNLEEKQQKMQVLWKQIAERFKNRSEKLVFETLNEPAGSTSEDAEQYNIMNKNVLNVIRSSGGHNKERLVLLPGLNTNIEKTINTFENPDPADKNLMLTVHNYDPWGFVSRSYGVTHWNDRDYFDRLFGQLSTFSKSIGLPVIIGEYGTLAEGTVEESSKRVYTDSFVRSARKYGMATFVWDAASDLLDRENQMWRDPILKDVILNASKGIPNAFIEKSALYWSEGEGISDQSLQIEFNGSSLKGIYHGHLPLKNGSDYTLHGSTLILKKEYLTSRIHNTGDESELRFKFKKGADQLLKLVKYKKPELAKTEVTIDKGAVTEDLKISTRFNGTTLAAVTALELNTIDMQTGTPLPMPVKEEWTNFRANNPFDGLRGGLNYGDFRSDGDFVYISKDVLNMMNDDAVFSFKFWPRDQEINVDVRIRLR